MKIPRDVSGQDLPTALCRQWRYGVVHQRGSHLVLDTEEPFHQRIAIPANKILGVATLNGILRSVAGDKSADRREILKSL